MAKSFIIETSARHVHLTKEAVNILFGKNYKLTPSNGVASVKVAKLPAGEYDVVTALPVVASVDHVEKEPGVFLVELTVTNLINDQTGWLYKKVYNYIFTLKCLNITLHKIFK